MDDKQREYYRKLYEKLSKKYTKEELVEAFVFPSDMSQVEEKEANRQLREERLKRLTNRTPEEKILSGLLRIKYQMKDYANRNQYDPGRSTLHFLNE